MSNYWIVDETPVYFLRTHGGILLISLLQTPISNLGLILSGLKLGSQRLILENVLGVGGSAVAFQAKLSR